MCWKALRWLVRYRGTPVRSHLKEGTCLRLTRSSCLELLMPRGSRTKYGDHSFSITAPTLWNNLVPKDMKAAKMLINSRPFKDMDLQIQQCVVFCRGITYQSALSRLIWNGGAIEIFYSILFKNMLQMPWSSFNSFCLNLSMILAFTSWVF
jgi:hypothetical protein